MSSAELLEWMGWVGDVFDHILQRRRRSGAPEDVRELPAHASTAGASMPGPPFRAKGVLHSTMHRWKYKYLLESSFQ